MGETSPLGVTAVDISPPLAFLRGVLCLNSHYVKASSCGMFRPRLRPASLRPGAGPVLESPRATSTVPTT